MYEWTDADADGVRHGRMDPLSGRLLVSSSGGWLAYVKCLSGRSVPPAAGGRRAKKPPNKIMCRSN